MLHGWEKLTEPEREIILAGIREGEVYGGPYHVELSPTDACNYTCFFCNTAFVDRSRRMPWDRLEKTLRDCIAMGTKAVRLSGGGEPLIYPEIEPLLDLLIDRGLGVTNLTTNAFRLTPKIIDKLLKLDTTEIIVSFNDLDPKRYASTNGTTEHAFHVVRENIRNLITERKARGLDRPKLTQQFFIWKENYEQIERAYDMALELDVDHIYIRDMWGIGADKRMTPSELKLAGEAIARLVERDREEGRLILGFSNEEILPTPDPDGPIDQVEQALRSNGMREPEPDRNEYCYIGWFSTVIRGNGEVYPCCMLAATEGYPPLGNVLERPFAEIWHGENYAQLRRELRDIALHQGRYDLGQDHCFVREFCSMRHACPFVRSLATPEFYEQADAQLAALRRRPAYAVRRAFETLSTKRPFVGAS